MCYRGLSRLRVAVASCCGCAPALRGASPRSGADNHPERRAARQRVFFTPSFQFAASQEPAGLAEQAVVDLLDGSIALAGDRLEPGAIQDGELPPAVTDEPSLLQSARREGNGGAAYVEHTAEKILGEGELVGLHPVLSGKQPTSRARLRTVVT